MYSIGIEKGVYCWLVFLISPDAKRWITLGTRETEEAALKLANDIRSGVMVSEISLGH